MDDQSVDRYVDPIVNQQLCDQLSIEDITNWMISLGLTEFACNFQIQDPDNNLTQINIIKSGWLPYIKDIEDYGSNSLMSYFIDHHLLNQMNTLLDIGYNPNNEFLFDDLGFARSFTPLILSIDINWIDGVRFLLDHGANPNIGSRYLRGDKTLSNEYDRTPLSMAALNRDINLVKILLDSGAQINQTTTKGTVLNSVSSYSGKSYFNMITFLIEMGADPNIPDKFGKTPLINTINYGQYKLVKLLLNSGSDPNVKDRQGRSAISVAIRLQGIKMVKLILNYGPDLNSVDNQNMTPILHALFVDSKKKLELLLKHGANPNIPEDNLPLQYINNPKLIKILKQYINE